MVKNRRIDPEAAFKNLVGIERQDESAAVEQTGSSDMSGATNPKPIMSASIETPQKEKLIPKTFYISEKQFRELKLRAAMSENDDEKDYSAIVRTALDRYFLDK